MIIRYNFHVRISSKTGGFKVQNDNPAALFYNPAGDFQRHPRKRPLKKRARRTSASQIYNLSPFAQYPRAQIPVSAAATASIFTRGEAFDQHLQIVDTIA